MIDIDRSAEANAIEHFLEEATASVPAAVLHLLNTSGDRVGETGDSTHEGWQQTSAHAADRAPVPALTTSSGS